MADINNLITDNIDVWTNAIKKRNSQGRGSNKKIELTGIKKLRELILELAVRGKLVPQDADDEPASVLLERVAVEKAQLIADKKIKKTKSLPAITDEEQPFKLPHAWEWNKLGNLSSDIHYGYTASAKHDCDGVRLLRITDIQNDKVDWHTVPACDISKIKSQSYLLVNDDILIARTGGTVGKSYLVENIDLQAVFASYLIRVKRISAMYAPFIKTYLGSQLYWGQLYDSASGTGQPNVNATALKSLVIPIPPLAEQHRIVTKVDELMLLCDELEQQTEQSLSAHKTLVEVLLSSLFLSTKSTAEGSALIQGTSEAGETAEDFQTSWQRIAEHFDVLFTTEHSIEQLKKTILQLAVMGKLVPQNPSDEPASVLLEKIAEEKAKLIADKKIKKQKILPEITEDEKPFELPSDWAWCKFGEVVNFKAVLVKPENYQMLDQVAPDSIEKGTGKLLGRRTVKESGIKGPNSLFYAGQLLYSKIRPSLSKAIIADFDGLCSADMYPLESMIYSKCLLKIILSEVFLEQVRIAENRIKMPKLNIDSLSNILIPLPPLKEQHRIVAKVDELMALCEQLKARLADAQTTQLHLADAVVENATT